MNNKEGEGKAQVLHVFRYNHECVGGKDQCIYLLSTRWRAVVKTVSCHGTEVTVLTGHGTAQASTGLEEVTKRKITNHFGNCNLVIQAFIILQFPIALLP